MTHTFELTARKTGLALSVLTALVLLIGYAGIQWLEGTWQPTSLEWTGQSSPVAELPVRQVQPMVLLPSVPSGAITTGWETPFDEAHAGDIKVDTASREREIR